MGAHHKLPNKQGQLEGSNSCSPFMQRKMRNLQLAAFLVDGHFYLSIYIYIETFLKIMDYARGAYYAF